MLGINLFIGGCVLVLLGMGVREWLRLRAWRAGDE